jgi:hypothetical protein
MGWERGHPSLNPPPGRIFRFGLATPLTIICLRGLLAECYYLFLNKDQQENIFHDNENSKALDQKHFHNW